MTLYVWRSDALKEYGRGTVAVAAKTLREARKEATKAFDDYLAQRYSYYDQSNPDDAEFLNRLRALLKDDLAQDPTRTGVLFVPGSE